MELSVADDRKPVQLDYQSNSADSQQGERMPRWLEYVQIGVILAVVLPAVLWVLISMVWGFAKTLKEALF